MTTEMVKKENVGHIVVEDIIGKPFYYPVLPELEKKDFSFEMFSTEICENDAEVIADFALYVLDIDDEKIDVEILIEKFNANFSGEYYGNNWSCGNYWDFSEDNINILSSENIEFNSVDELINSLNIEKHWTTF